MRRHIPEVLALIPSPRRPTKELLGCLGGEDGFIRYKAIKALERLGRREAPGARARSRSPSRAWLSSEIRRLLHATSAPASTSSTSGPSSKRDSLLGQRPRRRSSSAAIEPHLPAPRASFMAATATSVPRAGPSKRGTHAPEVERGRVPRQHAVKGDVRKTHLADHRRDPRSTRSVRKRQRAASRRACAAAEEDAGPAHLRRRRGHRGDRDRPRPRGEGSGRWCNDLEDVLEFRDAKDFAVFESVSEALAGTSTRLTGGRAPCSLSRSLPFPPSRSHGSSCARCRCFDSSPSTSSSGSRRSAEQVRYDEGRHGAGERSARAEYIQVLLDGAGSSSTEDAGGSRHLRSTGDARLSVKSSRAPGIQDGGQGQGGVR